MDEKHLVTRPAYIFSGVTLISRVLGLIRDILAAAVFGSGIFWDAFVTAFTVPNLFRRILGEGALNAAFVPVFTEHMHKKGERDAWHIASVVINVLAAVLVSLCLAVICILVFVRGFAELSFRTDLIIRLLEIIFPYVVFICLVGLFMGILSSFHRLFIPALSPVILNIVIITALLCSGAMSPNGRVTLLAFAVLLGGAAEFGIHIPALKRVGMRYRPVFSLNHPAVKRILFLMGPVVLGYGVTQINIIADRILALWLGPGSVSTLYFGNRLIQFPLGVFGAGLAFAGLPVMSKQAARNDSVKLKETIAYSMRIIFYAGIPAGIGLIMLRHPIVYLVFERDAFTHFMADRCSLVVLCYSLGIFAYLGIKMLTQCFYAVQDTKTPVKIAAYMVFLNLFLNIIFMHFLREAGLALATSVCAAANMGALLIALSKKIKRLPLKSLMVSFARSLSAGLLMAFVCRILTAKVFSGADNIFSLLCVFAAGTAVYLAASYLLGARELPELIHYAKERHK